MSLKSQIKELSEEIKTLEDKSASLQAESFAMRQEREGLIARMIIEDKLMQNTEWDLYADHQSTARMILKSDPDNNMGYLAELARTDYHSWIEIQDGVSFRLEEGEISLTFKETKMVVAFAKKNGITICGSTITGRLAQLKRDVAALEMVCHQFNLDKK